MQEEIGCFIFPEKTLTELSYKICEHILMHYEHKGAVTENTISVLSVYLIPDFRVKKLEKKVN